MHPGPFFRPSRAAKTVVVGERRCRKLQSHPWQDRSIARIDELVHRRLPFFRMIRHCFGPEFAIKRFLVQLPDLRTTAESDGNNF